VGRQRRRPPALQNDRPRPAHVTKCLTDDARERRYALPSKGL
jgi:hypothetical protein